TEAIIDADADDIDIGVTDRLVEALHEGREPDILSEEARAARQPDVQVFELRSPIAEEGVFDASTDCSACGGLCYAPDVAILKAVAGIDGTSVSEVPGLRAREPGIANGQAAGHVEQGAIHGIACAPPDR